MKKRTVIIILFIIISFSGVSLGKYFTQNSIEVESEILKPILKIEGDTILNINTIKENETYNLKIKNYNENNQITEVDLEYYIEILPEKNENIKFKIYKEAKQLDMYENKTEKNLLTKQNKQEDNYKIEILLNNISTQEIVQNIELRVHAEQKKINKRR